jgi:hypothetical protein
VGSIERIDAEAIDLQLDYWTMDSSASGSTNLSSAGSGVSSNLTSMTSSKLRGSDHSSSRTESKREGGKGSEVAGGGNKASIKTSFWFLQVLRLGVPSNDQPNFNMHYGLKEKKQKTVMRLGKKKEKDKEAEIRSVDGIIRLICLSKGQAPLKVHIDGLEWTGVKFFQLSSQWQTHIKYFPVAGVLTSSGGNTQTAL